MKVAVIGAGIIGACISHALAKRVWRHVDQLDFVSRVHHAVGHPFADLDSGDVFDDIGQAFQVLNVDRAELVVSAE